MQVDSDKKSTHLITFAVSHYCEKARWALERLNIPFIEDRHVPGFHWLYIRPIGGSVPVLITEAKTLTDSTDILHYLDAITPVNLRLYPTDPSLRQEVLHLADLFNIQLGPAIRCWAYFYLFNNRKLIQELWCEGVPPVERTLFPIVFPLLRSFAVRKLNITAETAAESLETIKQIFEKVNNQLADGRSYLVGDCFSAADFTFGCLAAPILMPPEYGGKLVQLHQLPDEMADVHQELRETPAGAYGLRLFREQRRRTY